MAGKNYAGKIQNAENQIPSLTSAETHTYERDVEIINSLGIHMRPAALFVKIASQYDSEVAVNTEGGTPIRGKSIMPLVTLCVEYGAKLHIKVSGNGDARECFNELVALVESGFGEK